WRRLLLPPRPAAGRCPARGRRRWRRFLFGQWAALQMAVRNRWGGGNAQAKARPARRLRPLLVHPRSHRRRPAGPGMDESFHADLEDGSIEEVA
ncbi:unnamed protein product, partial [Urochloa humidicola]